MLFIGSYSVRCNEFSVRAITALTVMPIVFEKKIMKSLKGYNIKYKSNYIHICSQQSKSASPIWDCEVM